jgi:hypothetical protein
LRKKPEWKVDEIIKLISTVRTGKILRKGRKIEGNAGIFSAELKDIEKALEKLNKRKQPIDPKKDYLSIITTSSI